MLCYIDLLQQLQTYSSTRVETQEDNLYTQKFPGGTQPATDCFTSQVGASWAVQQTTPATRVIRLPLRSRK